MYGSFIAFVAVFLGGEVLRKSWLDRAFVSQQDPALVGLVGENKFVRRLDQYSTMVWSASATFYAMAVLIPDSRDVLGTFAASAYVASVVGLVLIYLVGIRSSEAEFFAPIASFSIAQRKVSVPSARRLFLYGVPIALHLAVSV